MKSNREQTIVKTSIMSIVANLILAGFKAVVGWWSSSIAIVSDAVNNLSDSLSSIITIVGTKLAGKPADKKHPYGYGRIEYMTSLMVSVIVLFAGMTALIESVKKIFNPETPNYHTVTLVILVVAIILKFLLGIYVQKKGKEVNSDSLKASGADAFNDALLSLSVLASAIIYLTFKINLEAYVGVLLAIFIIKAGWELIRESVDNMLGVRIESDLARDIKKEVVKEKQIQGAYDLVLNDYGPDKYLGSLHIEVPDTLTVAEIDKISRRISKNIKDKYGVILHTIGVYSINTQDQKIIRLQNEVREIVFSHKGVLQMHGFYFDSKDKTISFDLIIDFKIKNREAVYQQILEQLQNKYPDCTINITLDVDVSD
ncbi:cation transporter [bacterium]|nr:cation transporter [bacterium]